MPEVNWSLPGGTKTQVPSWAPNTPEIQRTRVRKDVAFKGPLELRVFWPNYFDPFDALSFGEVAIHSESFEKIDGVINRECSHPHSYRLL